MAPITTPSDRIAGPSPSAQAKHVRRRVRRCEGVPPRVPLALAVALALGSGGLQAATFHVTTSADNGGGSLRQAVLDANAAPGADEITFDTDLDPIVLTGDQLDITQTLTITGPADGQTIDGDKDGGHIGRIFGVTSAGANLTLENLTLQNAKTTAVWVFGNCSSSSGQGGAICALGALTLTNSTVSGNTAAGGGGVYGLSTVTLTNSTIAGNTAANRGGGIYSAASKGGTITLTSSILAGNVKGGYRRHQRQGHGGHRQRL